jgi:hypothetical protein
MTPTQEDILKAVMQSGILGGVPVNNTAELNPEQAQAFIRRIFEATPMLQASRRVVMNSRTMNIDKIGIQNRLLRRRPENTAVALKSPYGFGQVKLSAKALQLPIEVTLETLLFNLEKESFEDTMLALLTLQVAKDLNEIGWSGQETAPAPGALAAAGATATATEITLVNATAFPYKGTIQIGTERINYDGKVGNQLVRCARAQDGTTAAVHAGAAVVTLLVADATLGSMNGWLFHAKAGGAKVVDGGAIDAGDGNGFIGAKHFKQAILSMPPNYLAAFGDRLKFIMHPLMRFAWQDWVVRNRSFNLGDQQLLGQGIPTPYGWNIFEDPNMPLNCMVFGAPENFITGIVAGQDVAISRDAISKEVLSRRVRYYQVDLMGDLQVERGDAVVVVDNIKDPVYA